MRRYFGTDGLRGRVGEGCFTAEFLQRFGMALARTLNAQGIDISKPIIMAQDTRLSSDFVSSAVSSGILAAGRSVWHAGTLPTPGLAWLTKAHSAAAGVMVSASHNVYLDNGIKCFAGDGFKFDDAVEHDIEIACDQPITTINPDYLGHLRHLPDAVEDYVKMCCAQVPVSLQGLKIAVDAANGACSAAAVICLQRLGAECLPMAHKPDGRNINHECGAVYPAALQNFVREHKADIGLAFDGDGDRLILIDSDGTCVDGDEIVYCLARYAQSRGSAKPSGVVGTVMSNLGLEQALAACRIPFYRAKVGDRYVLQECRNRGWSLGGENSGHIINTDLSTTGDALLIALQVLQILQVEGISLREALKDIMKRPQVMINIPLSERCALADLAHHDIVHVIQKVETELGDNGRVLVRPSGTEPLVRVMVEASCANEAERYAQTIAEVIANIL